MNNMATIESLLSEADVADKRAKHCRKMAAMYPHRADVFGEVVRTYEDMATAARNLATEMRKRETRTGAGATSRSLRDVMTMYHVTPKWDGGDLVPIGDEDAYTARWPDAGNLARYHAHVVHLHASRERAEEMQAVFGGEILVVDVSGVDVNFDTLEASCPHWTAARIPARAIKRLEV